MRCAPGWAITGTTSSPSCGGSRRAARSASGPQRGELDPADLAGIDAVVNLAGAGIAGHRWTDSYKREILDSRTRATSLISTAIAAAEGGPRVLLSGSGIDVYGDRGDETVDESSSTGTGFLSEVCERWEASTAAAAAAGVRVAHLRTSMVLSARGGALAKMLPLYRLGLGGRMGSGKQWMSWISIDDEVGAIEHLLDSDASGPVNLAAPNPVTNADFAHTLGRVLKRPAILPLPAFAPKLLLGNELVTTLLVEGKRVMPQVLQDDGFVFAHPFPEGACARCSVADPHLIVFTNLCARTLLRLSRISSLSCTARMRPPSAGSTIPRCAPGEHTSRPSATSPPRSRTTSHRPD